MTTNNKSLVSIIIPAKMSAMLLEDCLKSIQEQTYKNIETIIVDSDSGDGTKELAKKYKCTLYNYFPKVKKGLFDAPHKRNYGVKKAKGEYIYYVDADMQLTPNVVREAVEKMATYDAIIIPEDSFGIGIWARAKNLERQCYWGDDTIEAPRFVKKSVWTKLGGLDEILGGGGDDWDLYQKLLENGYKVSRIKSLTMHNEGDLKLSKLIKKRFMYGRDSLRYITKRPATASLSYFPIRKAYIKNWRLFAKRPGDTCAFIIMRTAEYTGAFFGILYSLLIKND